MSVWDTILCKVHKLIWVVIVVQGKFVYVYLGPSAIMQGKGMLLVPSTLYLKLCPCYKLASTFISAFSYAYDIHLRRSNANNHCGVCMQFGQH